MELTFITGQRQSQILSGHCVEMSCGRQVKRVPGVVWTYNVMVQLLMVLLIILLGLKTDPR